MSFRLLHSSDLHLGRAFGRFDEGIRGRLREARHGAIGRLAAAARAHGAAHVLLAGDTFDAETPAPATLRQALQAMAEAADIRWLMLPGNHDSLAATELWRRIAAEGPANLVALTDTALVDIAPGYTVLAAPCTTRKPGRDLTEALSQPTPEGAVRIGLAHGGVTDFGSEGGDAAVVPPDRAARSGLAYLALGDWHGQMAVSARTWYAGTPEADGFKHAAGGVTGAALLVTFAGDAVPEVQSVATGALDWRSVALDVLPGEDAAGRMAALLPPAPARRDTVLRIAVRGRLGLPERAALERALEDAAPAFGHFESDLAALSTESTAADIDLIAQGGALRQAAEALLAEAADPATPARDAAIARAALARLFAFATGATP